MPPKLAASLTRIQKIEEQTVKDPQAKAIFENIQKLIRVRSGPLFVLLICVRCLFYLSSHWYHLAANPTPLQGPLALRLALLAKPNQAIQDQDQFQIKCGQ